MIKINRFLQLNFAASLYLIAATNASAMPDRLVHLSCTNFPPSKFEHSTDGLPGYAIKFISAAFSGSGMKAKVEFYPWKRALNRAMTGTVDGLCSCSRHPGRDKKLIYSDPLGENVTVIFYRKSTNRAAIESLEDMVGREVGVVRGYNLHQELISHNVVAYPVNDEGAGIKMLNNNRMDLFYSFKAPGLFALSKQPAANDIGYTVMSNSPYFVCINKFTPGAENIVNTLNIGLTRIRADGTYDKILEKYR